jgi:hypothetical protein
MRLTMKDALATLAVAAAASIYGLWASGAAMSSASTRLVAAVVFALGWAACTSATAEIKSIYGPDTRRRPAMTYVVAASVVGGVALVAGLLALVTASEAMLATLVVSTIVLWAMATIRHAVARREPSHAPAHA